MRTHTRQAVSAAIRDRSMRRVGNGLRIVAIGMGIAFATSGAGAAGQANADGIVRFTGALVDLYDVTLEAPPVDVSDRATAVTLRFDAHGGACRART